MLVFPVWGYGENSLSLSLCMYMYVYIYIYIYSTRVNLDDKVYKMCGTYIKTKNFIPYMQILRTDYFIK